MQFVRIKDEEALMQAVYDILRKCGEDMYENQGLFHWRTPFPIEKIRENCSAKEVYVASDGDGAVATFQLETKGDMLELTKFAVLPEKSGCGIGGRCISYIEDLCRERGLRGISLDVYDQSKVAVAFYQRKGFTTVGTMQTKYFNVYLMEKLV